MAVVEIKEITPETILIKHREQYFCVHDFGARNARHKIIRARSELNGELTLTDIIRIANRNELKVMYTNRR